MMNLLQKMFDEAQRSYEYKQKAKKKKSKEPFVRKGNSAVIRKNNVIGLGAYKIIKRN